MDKNALEKLTNARAQLIMKFPFFGFLALNLKLVESNLAGGGGTCAVDSKGNFFYNPDFINKRNLPENIMLVCHEILHLVQCCHARFPLAGDFNTWNVASDYVVNGMIKETNLPTAPEVCPIFSEVYPDHIYEKYKGKTTEEIYLALLKESPTGSCSKHGEAKEGKEGDDPCPGDPNNVSDPRNGLSCSSGSLIKEFEENPRRQQEWTKKIIAAAETQNRKQGNLPGFLQDFLTEISKPKVTWKNILRRMAQARFRGHYTWVRPGRRSHAIGMRLQDRKPSPRGATVVIDTSGSISNQMISAFITEVVGIMRQCGSRKIKIYFHDVECYFHDEFSLNSLKKIKVQRGGTSHIPVLNLIHDNKDDTGLIVCFTDLMSSFPEESLLKCPVVWAVPEMYKDYDAPWGVKVVVPE